MHIPYLQRIFLADDTLPKDEIDDLFEQLEPIKPPPLLIQHILTSVSRLPRPTLPAAPLKQEDEEGERDALDSLVIRKEKLPPN
jgi:hypothetical protein